jgi:hypothetical protein
LRRRLSSGGQSEFRRHLIKERQHQRDATISHQNDIWLLTRSSIAPKWKGRRWDRLVRAEILKAR